ncbi:hypothetical protein BVX99_02975 [bacterium F16]|nr:hypothetical protein BVX99_02975 [bacterium F16]
MKKILVFVAVMMTVSMMLSSVEAKAKKTKKAKKPARTRVSSRYKEITDPESRERSHRITVKLTNPNGAHGTVYAVYKVSSGVYTCLSEKITESSNKQGKAQKVKGRRNKKNKKNEKVEDPVVEQEFIFPHTTDGAKFIDYLVLVRQGDKIISKKSSSSMWSSVDDTFDITPGITFNSKGESIGTDDVDDADDQ